MRVSGKLLWLLAWIAAVAPAAAQPATADLVAKLLPTMVRIETMKISAGPPAKPGGPATYEEKPSFGSGFIIDADGLIMTNWHVVASAREITVILQNGTRLKAQLVKRAPIDLATIHVTTDVKLPTVTFGDSDKIRQGDAVIAIGNPLGVGVTVTKGIISAINKGLGTSIWDDYLQIDAALNPGNSGGPLFNEAGEVIGINSALITPGGVGGSVGLGFSIPASDALFVMDAWKRWGRVRGGWLGANISDVKPDVAEAWGLARPDGVVVISVPAGTAAAAAGLLAGDVIQKIEGQDVADASTVYRTFFGADVGTAFHLTLLRGRQTVTLTVKTLEAPASVTEPAPEPALPSPPPVVARRDLGLGVTKVTDALRQTYHITTPRDGLVVTSVVPGSVAAQGGVAVGDFIVAVQRDPASTQDAMLATLDAERAAGRSRVVLVFANGDAVRWATYPLGLTP